MQELIIENIRQKAETTLDAILIQEGDIYYLFMKNDLTLLGSFRYHTLKSHNIQLDYYLPAKPFTKIDMTVLIYYYDIRI